MPAPDSLFAGWSGACVGEGSCVVPLAESRSVTARFMPRVKLTVAKQGLGNGTISTTPAGIECGPTCEADFVGGSSVSLSASADATSIFVGWSGDCTGTGACTVDMDSAKSVTANFQGTFRLTLVKQGGGQGTVTAAPDGIDCGATCSYNYRENERGHADRRGCRRLRVLRLGWRLHRHRPDLHGDPQPGPQRHRAIHPGPPAERAHGGRWDRLGGLAPRRHQLRRHLHGDLSRGHERQPHRDPDRPVHLQPLDRCMLRLQRPAWSR